MKNERILISRVRHNIREKSAIVKELKVQRAIQANASLYPFSRIAKAPTSRKLASTRAMSPSLTTAFLPVRTCAPSCFHSHLPTIHQRSSENRSNAQNARNEPLSRESSPLRLRLELCTF